MHPRSLQLPFCYRLVTVSFTVVPRLLHLWKRSLNAQLHHCQSFSFCSSSFYGMITYYHKEHSDALKSSCRIPSGSHSLQATPPSKTCRGPGRRLLEGNVKEQVIEFCTTGFTGEEDMGSKLTENHASDFLEQFLPVSRDSVTVQRESMDIPAFVEEVRQRFLH